MIAHPVTFLTGIACVGAWLYLLVGRGWFWRVSLRRKEEMSGRRVVAIVPARNESAVVARAVASLLSQENVDLRVVLVDDNSSDGTADCARTAAAQVGSDRLTVISGLELPAGWSGKLWAVQQGIEGAKSMDPDYLLLTDADVEHKPDNVASLVAIAERDQLDLASYMVRLHCATLAERLLIPAFVYYFFQLYPPQWISNPLRTTAGAAGGCILIRPKALAQAGAMNSIRHEIIDDCALAGMVKRSGGRVWLGLTESAASIRPYRSFSEVEHMIARTAFNQLRHSWLLLVAACLGLLLIYIAPVVLLVGRAWWLGIIACALMVMSYFPMVRFYRLAPVWALTLPVAASFYMAATLDSAFRYWLGKGGDWKGRAQDRAGAVNG